MNNLSDYNYNRGAWTMKHPPPTGKTIGESRFPLRSRTDYHPPPSIIYERRKLYRQTTETSPS